MSRGLLFGSIFQGENDLNSILSHKSIPEYNFMNQNASKNRCNLNSKQLFIEVKLADLLQNAIYDTTTSAQ